MSEQTSARATGNSITLTKWEGSTVGSVAANSTTTHVINTVIPANKIVVVSLNKSANYGNVTISLSNAGGIVTSSSGGWYVDTRMTYFKTTSSSYTQYTVSVVSAATTSISYTVNVAVVNLTSPFVPADRLGYSEYASQTYLISNSPELLNSNYYKGEWGYYLQRGKVNSRCSIYWEHYNNWAIAMKFGVLLWNKGNIPVVVTLASRSVKSASGSGSIENASTGVWLDQLNNVKQSDQSDLPVNGSVTIPAYSASNPSASALWVAMSSVPSGFFNGTLALDLKTTAGAIYTGSNLYCDTYIITPNYEHQIIPNVATMSLATPVDDPPLRGSGTGASLYASISETITITSANPYNVLITGFDPPMLQTGEKISLTTYKQDGTAITRDNGLNYGVRYCYVFSGFSSTGTIKAKIKTNIRTNPSIPVDPYAGIYVAGNITSKGNFSKLITFF